MKQRVKVQEGKYHTSSISGWKTQKFAYLPIKGNKIRAPTFPLPRQQQVQRAGPCAGKLLGSAEDLLKNDAALAAFSPWLASTSQVKKPSFLGHWAEIYSWVLMICSGIFTALQVIHYLATLFFSPHMKDILANSFPYIKAMNIMRQQTHCQRHALLWTSLCQYTVQLAELL